MDLYQIWFVGSPLRCHQLPNFVAIGSRVSILHGGGGQNLPFPINLTSLVAINTVPVKMITHALLPICQIFSLYFCSIECLKHIIQSFNTKYTSDNSTIKLCIICRATFYCCQRVSYAPASSGEDRHMLSLLKSSHWQASGSRRFSSPHPSVSLCVYGPGKLVNEASVQIDYATCYSSPRVGRHSGGRLGTRHCGWSLHAISIALIRCRPSGRCGYLEL